MKVVLYLGLLGCYLSLTGCATTSKIKYVDIPEPENIGVYHNVQKGETIWRIAKTYGVAIENIIQVNQIPDVAQIEQHQLLFIPGVTEVREIIVEDIEKQSEFIWPIVGKVIGHYNQMEGGYFKKGIDIQAPYGEEVKAARTGRVVFSDRLVGYGETVILDHEDGFFSVYAQNAKNLVSLGDRVVKNTPICQVGGTQKLSYMHFQIRKNAVGSNPLYYLP